MTTQRTFRFGVNLMGVDPGDIPEFARTVQRQGFDVLHGADHLGAVAPFVSLAAAATATDTLRLGTLVLNNEFWNPALLAREAASVDQLSGGRLELGLGAGHMKSEFDAAGIPWCPHPERVSRLERTVAELDPHFSESGYEPHPVQRPHPPLLIGAHGRRTLRVAAEHADIVGFGGLTHAQGGSQVQVAGPDEVAERVALVTEQAGARAAELEFNVLVQSVTLTDDAERAAAELAESFGVPGADTAEAVLASPFILVGTAAEVAAEILANRARFGFSYLVAHGPSRDALAEVIPQVRRLAGE